MFSCKACKAKDANLADLRKQVDDLRNITFPKTAEALPPDNVIEADAMLSGHQDLIEDSPKTDEDELYNIAAERDRILSGNY